MPAKKVEFTDMFGRPLSVGDAVAFHPGPNYRKKIEAGRIERFSSRMVSVTWTLNGTSMQKFAYPGECILLPIDDYLMYALTRS